MKIDRYRRLLFVVISTSVFLSFTEIDARPLNGARMTYVSHDVRLEATQGSRPVSVGDIVSAGTTISNGAEARSELTFGNQTVARLGANTILDVEAKPGAMKLRDGAMLFQIPKGSKTQIGTASMLVTSKCAIGLLERNKDAYIKLLVLEGEARVALRHRIGESIVVKAGEILIANPKATSLPEAAYFDIARVASTCQLISEFPPLRNQDLIKLEARKQKRLTNDGTYVPSNLVIFGRGTIVSLVPPPASKNAVPQKTPNPQPAN